MPATAIAVSPSNSSIRPTLTGVDRLAARCAVDRFDGGPSRGLERCREGRQVELVTEPPGERVDRPFGVVAAAVESPVDDGLESPPAAG